MKKLLFFISIIFLISCSDDDCDGKVSEINARYDQLILNENNGPGVPDLDHIAYLEQQRDNELGRACDQADIMPIPEHPTELK